MPDLVFKGKNFVVLIVVVPVHHHHRRHFHPPYFRLEGSHPDQHPGQSAEHIGSGNKKN